MQENPYQSPLAPQEPQERRPAPLRTELRKLLAMSLGAVLGFAVIASLIWRDATKVYIPGGSVGGFFTSDFVLPLIFVFPAIGALIAKWMYLRRHQVVR